MDQTSVQEKNEILQGPLKLAFTSQGTEELLSRGQKPKKFKFFDTSEHFGMELPQIPAKSLQKMAMAGSISRIERSITSFSHQRSSVMALTRYFGYAFLYRQFETRLWEIFLKSELVTQWNRQYPRMNMNAETNTQAQAFQLLIAKAQDQILAYKQEVLGGIQAKIQADPKSLPEEKKSRLLQAIRYLNAIDPAIWLLFALSKDPAATQVLIRDLKLLLTTYVERSELPEYLALMLVELVVIVGNITSMGLSAPLGTGNNHEPVFLSYELGVLKKSQEEKMRVRIVLGNETKGYEGIKSKIDHSAPPAGTKAKSLDSYFGEGRNQDLGLMYLSYVKEASHKMDIFFDSFVNQIPHSKQTLVNITLTL